METNCVGLTPNSVSSRSISSSMTDFPQQWIPIMALISSVPIKGRMRFISIVMNYLWLISGSLRIYILVQKILQSNSIQNKLSKFQIFYLHNMPCDMCAVNINFDFSPAFFSIIFLWCASSSPYIILKILWKYRSNRGTIEASWCNWSILPVATIRQNANQQMSE